MPQENYFKIGRAADLKSPRERLIYRLLEILPGGLSWLTLFLAVFLSWLKPLWVAVFIISFVIYWLFRTIYFSFHLWICYRQMKKNEKTDWLLKLAALPRTEDIYQLIILPMYKEPREVIREAVASLLFSEWPKKRMLVVLSCEEGGNRTAAETVKQEFQNKFFKFLLTYHPPNLPGEISGKGANENWGEKKAKELIIDHLKIAYADIIVSSLDADTVVFPKYFSCLTYYYLTDPTPLRSSYQPVPLFVNNIWQAPFISRIFAFSATFWQMMCQERPEKLLTFSSHAMSFQSLVDVDFRQVNVVSDDSRIFWQSFFEYNGDYRVQPIYYPISLDANCGKNFWQTMKNIYLQQRRWAWGAAEIPYVFFGFLKNKKIPLAKKFSLGFTLLEGHWSWAATPFLIFLLGWLPLVLGSETFNRTLFIYNLPDFVSRILTMGMAGIIASIYFSILLLPPRKPTPGRKKYLFFALEWLLLPLNIIFFSALPALDAQTRLMAGKYLGFWPTPKIRK